jgi:hypothetical protein
MSLSCPNCKTVLPQDGELEYRFCPHCGADITAPGAEIAEDFQTIPPDLDHTVGSHHEQARQPDRVEKPSAANTNQTPEPVIAAKIKPRPAIVPPPGQPPKGFYRPDSPHPTSRPVNIRAGRIIKPRKSIKLRIIAIGAIAIILGGILFLWLVS